MNLRHSILSASLLILGVAASVMASTSVSEAGSKPVEVRKPVITKPKFDPSAERVEFFKGMEDGQLETRFVPKDANGGFLLVTNTTEEPITVDLPDAFVAVQVLKQFGGGGMGGGGMGGGGMGGGGGGGFFSIPPERTVRVPYVSACLNHGKPDPSARLEYKLVPVDKYTDDKVLAELIRMVGTGRVNQHSAQAAIWTRTDNMSWQELAAKHVRGILSVEYYFNSKNIQEGQLLMATAEGHVREKSGETEKPKSNEAGSPRVR